MPRYLNPSIHGVTRIEAHPLAVSGVDLTFTGRPGTPDAEFSIYGEAEDREKFRRLADAINAIFAAPVAPAIAAE